MRKLQFDGFIAKDPQTGTTKTGKPKITFQVSTKNKGDEKPLYVLCTLIDDLALEWNQRLSKDDFVYVTGSASFSIWKSKNGPQVNAAVFVDAIEQRESPKAKAKDW